MDKGLSVLDESRDGIEPAPEVIMDANGAYWRRYDEDTLSMCRVSTDNEPLAYPVAVYRLDGWEGGDGGPLPWPSTHAQHAVLLAQIKDLHAENERLREALTEALDLAVEGWGYSSPYFIEKWDFHGRYNALCAIRDAGAKP